MIEKLESIIYALIGPGRPDAPSFVFNPTENRNIPQALNTGFLITLAGPAHPDFTEAIRFLESMLESPEWGGVAQFYREGLRLVRGEIKGMCENDPHFADRLNTLADWVSNSRNLENLKSTAEKFWAVFFPEANGILEDMEESIKALRSKRKVTITELNAEPITDPARQLIFTSNVLITIPPETKSITGLPLSEDVKEKLVETMQEPQLYWYDHPIQVGVEQHKNEVFYGLRNLEAAFEFEKDRGNISEEARPICVLSVSVTHRGLQDLAKKYLEEEFARSGELKKLDLYAFTEADTQRIITDILAPAALHYLHRENGEEILKVFGVDGEYGRHYSFLKAIAAFWKVFVNAKIRGTFKIDIDQVFPQKELVEETGASAFEHLKTPLWGAHGVDSGGRPLELGMIAGALVNEKDIRTSLFTPDVRFPDLDLSCDEFFFFSPLPQALSTEAEMMLRYTQDGLDGQRACAQRIHVTGGTNGILVDSLERHRPFTPSFMGRAEDQAYILSVLMNPGTKLAYVHKDGLIMRHDKEVFAQEAIESAFVGKLIGDYVRIIYFSAYAAALTDDVTALKEIIDPFTGCFVSLIPATVVYLRFCFKAASFFAMGKNAQGIQFIRNGADRITRAMDFVSGEKNMLKRVYEKERLGWNMFYDTISAVEDAIRNKDEFALELQKKADIIVDECAIAF